MPGIQKQGSQSLTILSTDTSISHPVSLPGVEDEPATMTAH